MLSVNFSTDSLREGEAEEPEGEGRDEEGGREGDEQREGEAAAAGPTNRAGLPALSMSAMMAKLKV